MEQKDDKPKWLVELENRKLKPRLGHETGAGAPCLTCESMCPGLDLHFWRKICKNCKCRGDEHDFDDEDFPQFELLFGPNVKNKKNRSVLLKINNKKIQSETPFDWIPPNTSLEIAADYMNALPSDKLPIKDSLGAALRKQQLKKQLPLHDVDDKACNDLSKEEKKEFNKYLDNLKNCAGQGKVFKLTTIKPFDRSQLIPANVSHIESFCPESLKMNEGINLHTPSSFISNLQRSHFKSNVPSNFYGNIVKAQQSQALNKIDSHVDQYHHTSENIPNASNLTEIVNVPTNHYSKALQSDHPENQNIKFMQNNPISSKLINTKHLNFYADEENIPSSSSKLIEPLSHQAKNKIYNHDKNNFIDMENKLNDKSNNKNEVLVSSNKMDNTDPSLSKNFEIKSEKVDNQEFNSGPTNFDNDNNKNPALPFRANKEPTQAQVNTSLPVQSNIIYSESLNNPIFAENAVGFLVANKNSESINNLQEEMEGMTMSVTKAHKCNKCEENILCGDVAVSAEKIKGAVWHPGCFVCSACNELLVDLVYFTHKNKLYCGRDLAELLKIPRCFACDELIFVREYTAAEGHKYHIKHFCCWDCDIPLAGQQYVTESSKPLCLPCYKKNYAKTCKACNNVIAADQQGVAIKNIDFHATDECFCCFVCKKSLFNGQIAVKENKLFCCKECVAVFLSKI